MCSSNSRVHRYIYFFFSELHTRYATDSQSHFSLLMLSSTTTEAFPSHPPHIFTFTIAKNSKNLNTFPFWIIFSFILFSFTLFGFIFRIRPNCILFSYISVCIWYEGAAVNMCVDGFLCARRSIGFESNLLLFTNSGTYRRGATKAIYAAIHLHTHTQCIPTSNIQRSYRCKVLWV